MAVRLIDPMLGYTLLGHKGELIDEAGWTSGASASSGYNPVDGPFGEGMYGVGGFDPDYWMAHSFTACAGRVIMQEHYMLKNVAGGGSARAWEFYNNSGTHLCLSVKVTDNGEVEIYDAGGNLVGSTVAGTMVPDVWKLSAVEAAVGSASGIVKLWVDVLDPNGAPTLSLTGVNMTLGSSGGCDRVLFHGGGTNRTANHSLTGFIGDSADTEFNKYLGNRYWRPYMVEAAGDSTEFIPNTGDNWECVDDIITTNGDEDTTYVEDPATPADDEYEIEDASPGLHGIYYVIALASVKQTGAGTPGTLQLNLRHAGTNSYGDTLSTTTNYRRYWHGSKNVPGGIGWTKENIDALQIGYTSSGSSGPLNRISRIFAAVFAYPDDYTPPSEENGLPKFTTTRASRTLIYVPQSDTVVEQPCHKEYATFVYGTGVTYGVSTCPPAGELYLNIDTPARDLIQIITSVEFVVNPEYFNPSNYVIIDAASGKQLHVRKVLKPFNNVVSNRILLFLDKHVAGTEYQITIKNLVRRNGAVLDPTIGLFIARDGKANSMLAALPDHFNTDPKTSVLRQILQAMSESDDKIGSLR